MLLLIFLSILLELFFIHITVELYREKKINLSLFIIFMIMIIFFLVRNLFAMNTYLYTNSRIENWYVEVMIFFVSTGLVALVVMMKKIHRPLLMANEASSFTFEDALKRVPMKDVKIPFVILNTDGKIVYLNKAFSQLIGDRSINILEGLSFSKLFNSHIEEVSEGGLNQATLMLKQSNGMETLVQLTCQVYDESGHLIVFLQNNFKNIILEKEFEALRKKSDFLDDVLAIGCWEIDYNKRIFEFSDRTKEIFGFEKNKCTLDMVKSRIHSEEIIEFERSMQKAKWLNGHYTIDLRLHVDGHEKFVTVFYEAFLDGSGSPYKFKGIILDLSKQRQTMYNRILNEKYDVVGGMVQEINEKTYGLLEALSKEKSIADYKEKIVTSMEVLELYQERYLKEAAQKNLVHCDKIIEQTVAKLLDLGKKINIKLNLDAYNSLVNISEESFERLLTHLFHDKYRTEAQLEVTVETEISKLLFNENQYKYIFRMKLLKKDVTQVENETFKDRFYKVPLSNEETGLYHAYSIIKKYNGKESFFEDGLYYIFRVEFPSIQF